MRQRTCMSMPLVTHARTHAHRGGLKLVADLESGWSAALNVGLATEWRSSLPTPTSCKLQPDKLPQIFPLWNVTVERWCQLQWHSFVNFPVLLPRFSVFSSLCEEECCVRAGGGPPPPPPPLLLPRLSVGTWLLTPSWFFSLCVVYI